MCVSPQAPQLRLTPVAPRDSRGIGGSAPRTICPRPPLRPSATRRGARSIQRIAKPPRTGHIGPRFHDYGDLERLRQIALLRELRLALEDFDHTQYEDEVRERWGDSGGYRESMRRTRRYGTDDWARIKEESRTVFRPARGTDGGGTGRECGPRPTPAPTDGSIPGHGSPLTRRSGWRETRLAALERVALPRSSPQATLRKMRTLSR